MRVEVSHPKQVNYVTMMKKNDGSYLISIDTINKYHDSINMCSSYNKDRCVGITLYFTLCGKSYHVKLIPTTKKDKELFNDSYFLQVSQRYGATYLLTPAVNPNAKQYVLWEK